VEKKLPEDAKAKKLKNLKPFQKGNKGGPGRPKGSRSAKDIYSHVGSLTMPKVILEKLKAQGIVPTQKDIDSVIAYANSIRAAAGNIPAMREYNDRRFGKAPQDIKMKGELDLTNIQATNEQLAKVIQDYGLLEGTE